MKPGVFVNQLPGSAEILNSDADKRGFAQSKRFADGIRYVKGRKTDFFLKNPRLSAFIRVQFFELSIAAGSGHRWLRLSEWACPLPGSFSTPVFKLLSL